MSGPDSQLCTDKVYSLTVRAVWTRFHPIMYAIQDVLFSGKLGKVKRFQADFSMFFDVESKSVLMSTRSLADSQNSPTVTV